jgi:hypothetical protein
MEWTSRGTTFTQYSRFLRAPRFWFVDSSHIISFHVDRCLYVREITFSVSSNIIWRANEFSQRKRRINRRVRVFTFDEFVPPWELRAKLFNMATLSTSLRSKYVAFLKSHKTTTREMKDVTRKVEDSSRKLIEIVEVDAFWRLNAKHGIFLRRFSKFRSFIHSFIYLRNCWASSIVVSNLVR